MKKILCLIQLLSVTAGFSENPRWKYEGDSPIPARADLDVRWDVQSYIPPNEWPTKLWVYQLAPRRFSPREISNLMRMCSFTEKDRVQQDTNGVTFKSPDGSRTLVISFSSGTIRYDAPEPQIRVSSVFKNVPETKEIPKLTKDFLKQIGIRLSEIQKNTNGVLYFPSSNLGRVYLTNHTFITNIWAREVSFRRSVDGVEVIGDAGYCGLQFGEHGKISKIELSWPDLKRYKSAPTLKLEAITQLIRQGKARQGATLDNGYIDWLGVKSIAIKQAWPCYFAGDSNFLYPFLALWTTVNVGIDCPIIDEAKLSGIQTNSPSP
jgi:hypothetical protein